MKTLSSSEPSLPDVLLPELGVSPERADRFLPALRVWLPLYGIDRPLRLAHFLAQVLHESGRMRYLEENLHYSAERLLEVFPRHFSTLEQAARYANNPENLGNFVYANRLGNGPEGSGDGYRYRGRGLLQITGRTHYRQFSRFVEVDVLAEPERVASEFAVASAVYFWSAKNLNSDADVDDLGAVTRKVNGGLNGLSERARHLRRAKELLGLGGDADLLQPTHRVNVAALNLRSAPRVASSTLRALLRLGQQVSMVSPAPVPGWVEVLAAANGRHVQGFVAERYLEPIKTSAPTPAPHG